MPITRKRKGEADGRSDERDEAGVFTMFVYKPHCHLFNGKLKRVGNILEVPEIQPISYAKMIKILQSFLSKLKR